MFPNAFVTVQTFKRDDWSIITTIDVKINNELSFVIVAMIGNCAKLALRKMRAILQVYLSARSNLRRERSKEKERKA